MSGSKAENTSKTFQSDNLKIDANGTEVLPTMTHSTSMRAVHKSEQIGLLRIFYLPASQKAPRIHH